MGTVKYITKDYGTYDGFNIDEYIKRGGFKGLKKSILQGYEKTVQDVSQSGLQGRGGANYPTGRKLTQAREAKGNGDRYILCNADEGEPGTFKDKYLLQNGIYKVIEGIIISAFCAGANKGYIYVREEYTFMHKDIEFAIKQVYDKGFLGEDILSSGFDFDLSLFSGGGSYVCGEGFAMCESIEGKSGRPRSKPPYVKECGLHNKPTLVINVETVSVIATMIQNGFKTVLKYGVEDCPGTKMVCVSGKVKHPGVYEVEFGTTVLNIIKIAGGIKGGKKAKFVQIGGASGVIVPYEKLNIPYTYSGMKKVKGNIGSGAIVVADEDDSVINYLSVVEDFFFHECCGKCVPCREGNRQLKKIMDRFKIKQGTLTDLKNYVRIVNALDASLCGSGKAQIIPFISAYTNFSEEFKNALKREE